MAKLMIYIWNGVKHFFKWFKTYLPFLLFALSFLAYLMVLAPNLVLKRLPLFGRWPRKYELVGEVLLRSNIEQKTKFTKTPGAIVEIGGYRTVCDGNSCFRIEFVSDESNDIPMIIRWSDQVMIERISFDKFQFNKTVNVIVNE